MSTVSGVPGRSDEPFFHQPNTTSLINEIARAESLVIYAGAGVTKAETGHTWSSMVKLLFAQLIEEESLSTAIAASFDLPKRASIIREYFQRSAKGAASQTIANSLRTSLYPETRWNSGEYATTVGLLCKKKVAVGHKVVVVTTNYDQHLEKALRKTPDEIHSLTLPLSGQLDTGKVLDELAEHGDKVSVVHLHGSILQVPKPGMPEDIVLDEVDYLRTENQTNAILTSLFNTSNVLILGSSLEDAPLMRALWKTRGTVTRRRWAVFPRQNYAANIGAYGGHRQTYSDLIYALERRCSLFDLDIISPDFFSQASQFAREVAVSCDCTSGQQEYAQASYNRRLSEWWNAWFEPRSKPVSGGSIRKATVEAQRRDHRGLLRSLGMLQKEFFSTKNNREKLKLELWVRWEPTSRNRGLQLWASSTGTWIDCETMRNVQVHAYSEYLAVKSFCEGVACAQQKQGREHERWKNYIAVPVSIGPEPRTIQAGVIVLATTETGTSSIMNEDDDTGLTTMRALSLLLAPIGTRLLSDQTSNSGSAKS